MGNSYQNPAQPHIPSGTHRNKPARYFLSIFAIIRKDLTVELRSRELLSTLVVFDLLVILIFNYAIELEPAMRIVITPGVLWVTFIFAGTLGLNRSIAIEKDHGGMDALLLAPIDRSVIYFGKMVGNLIIMIFVEIIILPIYSFLYNINLFQSGLILLIILGSLGFITVGTLLSSMTIHTRSRDMLLPILLFPVAIPLLMAVVKASEGFLSNADAANIAPWINLIVVYDVIFLALSYMLFDYLVED